MINKVAPSSLSFKSKSFNNKGLIMELINRYQTSSSAETISSISAEKLRALALSLNKNIEFEKYDFGYKVIESQPLSSYNGPKNFDCGFSTQDHACGGGWLKPDINVPLSTSGIHSCSAINLVDDKSGKHILYHVFYETTPLNIVNFIYKQLPRFNKANIIPGDSRETKTTTHNIMLALNRINPIAEKNFFHFSTPQPEIVAHNGSVFYMRGQKPECVSFQKIIQYN